MLTTRFRHITDQKLTDGLENWLDIMRKNGIRLIILSNSKEKRVKPFAEKIGLDYISLGLKPLPFRFSAARRRIGSLKKDTAIVGDQIFTDTLGGNLYGVKTVLLDPTSPKARHGLNLSANWNARFIKYIT